MYNSKNWQEFLAEAKERDNKYNSRDDNYVYKDYEDKLKKAMLEFNNVFKSLLRINYVNYIEAISDEFSDRNYIDIDEEVLKLRLSYCKILILTANPIERAILHHHVKNNGKIERVIVDDIIFNIFKWGQYWIVHIPQIETGSNKDYGTLYTLHKALRSFTPNVIFSMGVAYGIDFEKQKIGDVIVSKKILPYSENKQDAGKLQPVRNQDKHIDNWLHTRFNHVIGFLSEVTYGDILTGGTVLSDSVIKDNICLGYTEADFIIGGEMEGNALFQISKSDEIPCAVIKGICDWGVAKNNIFESDDDDSNLSDLEEEFKDSLQAYAMYRVVSVCDKLFNNGQLFRTAKSDSKRAIEKRYSTCKFFLHFFFALSIVSGLIIGLFTNFVEYVPNYNALIVFNSIATILMVIPFIMMALLTGKPSNIIFSIRNRYKIIVMNMKRINNDFKG